MNIERLNININGVSSPGFSGDNSVFSELAVLVGDEIPGDYIEFVAQANGGHPEIGCFSVIGDDTKDNLFDVDWFYSVNSSSIENVRNAILQWGGLLGPKKLPIGRDGGDNQIYLNLEDETPTVWLYLHDENEARLKLSNSFPEFLDGLIMNPDFI